MLESREPINQKQIWFAYPVGLREGGGTLLPHGWIGYETIHVCLLWLNDVGRYYLNLTNYKLTIKGFKMETTTNNTAVATATNTTNVSLTIDDLCAVGTIVNHKNRSMIMELFGDRIVSLTPPSDVLLPNGYALPKWSISLLNIASKFEERFGLEKSIDIAFAVLQSFLPYAPFATAVKDKDGDVVNVILTFKSTAEMNLATMAESLSDTDITYFKSKVNLSKIKIYSFKQRAYLMLDGTVISE